MAAIDYAFAEVNTAFTATNTSYAAVTGATIASGSFTAGKKYLILVRASTANATAGSQANLRMVHGSTAFAESELLWYAPNAGGRYYTYSWFTVWTAVSGEAITLQNQSTVGTTQTVNFVALLALNLSDSVTENTDWLFNGLTTDTPAATDAALTTTPANGASITIPSPPASTDWLVLAYAQLDASGTGFNWLSSLTRSGEASSTTPSCSFRPGSATHQLTAVQSRVFTLGAASNTFKESSSSVGGSAHTRLHSAVFALNLHKFAWRIGASGYTGGGVSLITGGGSFPSDTTAQVQTATVTPSSSTTMILGATFVFDVGQYNTTFKYRSQSYVDGGAQSDQPAGQTTASYNYLESQFDSTSEFHAMHLTAMAQTGGSTYRTDVDALASVLTNTPTAKDRQIWGFSVELAVADVSTGATGSAATTGHGTHVPGIEVPL